MQGKTTIIIPALNEGAVIGGVVRKLRECHALQQAGITDIIVVDNGSDDDTAYQAELAGARVVHEPHRGYGRACLAGVLAATDADIIVQMDGDGSDVPEDIVRVWQPVREGRADLAMGARGGTGAERGALTPQQIVGNAVGAMLLRALYGVRVSDIGPLRAIRRETVLHMHMQEMTYGWSTEMLAKAGRLGLRVAEVPVSYRRRAGGESKVAGTLSGTLKASWRILATLGKYVRWEEGKQRNTEDTEILHGGHGSLENAISRRALFIVARLPVAGQTKTRLGRIIGHERAALLYAAFLRDLGERFTAAAQRDGYDLWWFYAAPNGASAEDFAAWVPPGGKLLRQGEGDFGARLWQGFRDLAGRGYEQIVVMSSDSPHVPASRVRDAFAALDHFDAVIAPADDGGYYLLGQRGALLDCFSAIPMSTPHVFAQTVATLRAAGKSLAELPITFDIDEPADLDSLRAVLRAAPDLAPTTRAVLAELPILAPQEAGYGAE